MNIRTVRTQAENLVESLGLMEQLPIDVRAIAKKLGLQIIEGNLGDEVSGLLVSDNETSHIFIQKDNHENRKRFTIGHEIGHFYLKHQSENDEHIIVDKGYYISQRGPKASEGVDQKEIEANQFAACLLMPSKTLEKKVEELGFPLFDQDVSQLAKDFGVSEQAITIRLSTLGLL